MARASARPPQPAEAHGPSHRRGVLLASAVLVAAGAAAYANSFSGRFFLDDYHTILDNPLICDFWPRMALLWSNRVVVNLSFVVNYAISGARTWSYHLVNLALHLIAALALFGVVRRTLLTERMRDRFGRAATPLALASAGLWMLHPLTTSAVTYVTQRYESAMGMFFLLTLYGVIRGATEQKRGWYVAAVAACFAGMASKEVIAAAPVVVAGYDRIFLARSWREVLHRRWGLYLGLLAAWVVVLPSLRAYGPLRGDAAPAAGAAGAGGAPPGPPPVVGPPSPMAYARTQFEVIVHYLGLAFWPRRLCLDYGWPVARQIRQVVPHALLVGGLLLLTAWALWQRPAAGFLGVWFFLVLAPSSSILPITDLAFEHRMYLPLAAVTTLLVVAGWWLVFRRLGRRGAVAGAAAAAVVAAALGVRTFFRNRDYASRVGMWQDVVALRPQNPRAHLNLGEALLQAGDPGAARGEFQAAIDILPEYALAHESLAVALSRDGQPQLAERKLRDWLKDNPGSSVAHYSLGVLLDRQGRIDEAIEHYRQALRHNRRFAEAYSALGAALARKGPEHWHEALAQLKVAVRLKPHYPDGHYNLGLFYADTGRPHLAEPCFRRAVRLDPEHALAHASLGLIHLQAGRTAPAIECLRLAGRLAPDHAEIRQRLAEAYRQAGRLADAVAAMQEAIALARQAGEDDLADRWTGELRTWQGGATAPKRP